jgi:predicted ester cyclase
MPAGWGCSILLETTEEDAMKQIVAEAMARMDSGDLEGFRELIDPAIVAVFPGAELHGLDEWSSFVQSYIDAFPGGLHELTDLESVGETVFAAGFWKATHTGTFVSPDGDIPPTGNRVELPFSALLVVRDGRIVSIRNHFDRLEFMSQLGLVPAAA